MERETLKICVKQYANSLMLAFVLEGDVTEEKLEGIPQELGKAVAEAYREYLDEVEAKLYKVITEGDIAPKL